MQSTSLWCEVASWFPAWIESIFQLLDFAGNEVEASPTIPVVPVMITFSAISIYVDKLKLWNNNHPFSNIFLKISRVLLST